MYVNLNTEFLEKNLEQAKEDAIEEVGKEDGKHQALWADIDANVEIADVDEDSLIIGVSSELGYFSISIPLTPDLTEDIIKIAIKKMNKIKQMLETLK